FPLGQRSETVKSIAVFCRERAASLAAERNGEKVDPVEKRRDLRALLRLAEPLELRGWIEYPVDSDADPAWRRIAVTTKDGRLFPLLLRNRNMNECRLVIHGAGKAEAMRDEAWQAISGTTGGLAVADLWGSGETDSADHAITRHHDFARGHLWVGRTLMGEWVRTLEFLGNVLRTKLGFRSVSLVGMTEGSLAALVCGALGGWDKITAYDAPLTLAFGDKPRSLSMGIHVPGMLRWGDVPLLAALTECPVHVERPRLADASPADRESAATFVRTVERHRPPACRGGVCTVGQ
ncbi:MAG: hypothetical protein PHR35_05270, partial [Kiritimatiellae bacterium]|nr:hypothetical protein [Kiritimatiellia bacterium]